MDFKSEHNTLNDPLPMSISSFSPHSREHLRFSHCSGWTRLFTGFLAFFTLFALRRSHHFSWIKSVWFIRKARLKVRFFCLSLLKEETSFYQIIKNISNIIKARMLLYLSMWYDKQSQLRINHSVFVSNTEWIKSVQWMINMTHF